MVATLLPTSEQVAIAWLRSLGLPNVATNLPSNEDSWKADGFVVVSVIGGSPDIDIPMSRPVLQIDCYATKGQSAKPPWGDANAIIEQIRAAAYNMNPAITHNLTLPGDYKPVRVFSTYLLMEPRRITDSNTSYARYMTQLMINWTY